MDTGVIFMELRLVVTAVTLDLLFHLPCRLVRCALCSCFGYVKAFQMYTGKEKTADTGKGLAHRVVTELVVPHFSHRNHVIYMDNFFASLPLFADLAKFGIYACGIYRSNRVGFP